MLSPTPIIIIKYCDRSLKGAERTLEISGPACTSVTLKMSNLSNIYVAMLLFKAISKK